MVERLRARASETEGQLRARLGNAVAELEAIAEFDYVVVNDDLEASIGAVAAIVAAEERAVRQLGDGASARGIELRGEIRRALE